jgi:hypothetical protein
MRQAFVLPSGETHEELAPFREFLAAHGWAILQTDDPRAQAGDILGGSDEAFGCALVIVGIPTKEEEALYYERLGTPIERGRFALKVSGD